ncbi:hypothetical protein EHLJMEHL_05019 [Vreelandella titanicae]
MTCYAYSLALRLFVSGILPLVTDVVPDFCHSRNQHPEPLAIISDTPAHAPFGEHD